MKCTQKRRSLGGKEQRHLEAITLDKKYFYYLFTSSTELKLNSVYTIFIMLYHTLHNLEFLNYI